MSILINIGAEIISSDTVVRVYKMGLLTCVELKDKVFLLDDEDKEIYKRFEKACEVFLEKNNEQKS